MQVISLIFIFYIPFAFCCELKKDIQIYSLSSPITMLLEELELLNKKQVLGISVFHPVKKFQGQKLAGGIFLSNQLFENSKGLIVFYDESQELNKKLSRISNINSLEIKTRELGAFSATKLSIQKLRPFLIGCELKLKSLEGKIVDIKKQVSNTKLKHEYLFYLNPFISKNKKPSLVIVNDGFVKSLIQFSKLKTYPSRLGYVNWSSKIMKKIGEDAVHIGVSDSLNDKISRSKLTDKVWNIDFRGALSPGIRQVYFMQELLKVL